jgi:metal-dependent amidase/aminoacylase/carboxypeptidase family protein
LLGLLSSSPATADQSTSDQQLTSKSDSAKLLLNGVSNSTSGIAGTANDESETGMKTALNFLQIFSGYGANVVPERTPVDMHIQLSSNTDFEDALKQVMHVAQLTQTSESRTPMRVAIEIQTPPGAIVNVYVSRQNDQWRAQLSTNDPQALSWVQDKMTSLRQSSDLGVDVKWLPPQIESAATSAGNESNLGWDRGGQNQPNYQQQQDERQQPTRQKRAEVYAGIGSGQFMETLTAVGGTA